MMDANVTAKFASDLQQSQISNEIAFAVAAKSLKTQKQQGEANVALVTQIEQATSQLANGRIDVEL